MAISVGVTYTSIIAAGIRRVMLIIMGLMVSLNALVMEAFPWVIMEAIFLAASTPILSPHAPAMVTAGSSITPCGSMAIRALTGFPVKAITMPIM